MSTCFACHHIFFKVHQPSLRPPRTSREQCSPSFSSSRMSPSLRPCRSDASSPNCLSSRRQSVHPHLTYLPPKSAAVSTAEKCVCSTQISCVRNSRRVQYSAQKGEAQTVGLSAFDVVIDIISPTSPVSDASPLSSSTVATPP